MSSAYVDTSVFVAIALGEPGGERLAGRLSALDRIYSSDLLEAELLASLQRENVDADPGPLLSAITWIRPDRRLTSELRQVLAKGHVRGADLWHLACALLVAGDHASELIFLTLDSRQKKAATTLGFQT